MPNTILVTGANRGIGLELVNQYSQAGWLVHAACRNPEQAIDLKKIADDRHGLVTIHALDVTNHQQIADLAQILQHCPIDILMNNAGIYGPKNTHFGETDKTAWAEVFNANTISVMAMMEAFVEHVASSEHKIIANMSSKMASMDDNGSGGSYLYRSAKAALNAISKSAAIDLSKKGITVALLHPGWVKTEMGGSNAEISTATCARNLRAILDKITLADSGRFFDIDGTTIAW